MAHYPADTFQEATELAIEASNQLYGVINGDANAEVIVEDGSKIPSVRKAMVDSLYFKPPIAWSQGEYEDTYNQLREFVDGDVRTWWFAKGATVSTPVLMSTNPHTDQNWSLWGAVTVKRYACVADMVSDVSLSVGQIVETLGYYAVGDGGANDYEIVATTGGVDGGSYINLSINGYQAKGLFSSDKNPRQFGAKGTGRSFILSDLFSTLAEANDVYQSATDLSNEVDTLAIKSFIARGFNKIPAGKWIIDEIIGVEKDNYSLYGDKGSTVLISKTGNPIIGPSSSFKGQYFTIDGFVFRSLVPNLAYGIYSDPYVYVSHWRVSDCVFEASLAIGIKGNLIVSKITSCSFGLYGKSTGFYHKAIESVGQFSPLRETNINVISDCEFAFCESEFIIDFQNGTKQIFERCVFEENKASSSLVKNYGVYYPEFSSCWFERNTTNSFLHLGLNSTSGIDSVVLLIENCVFQISSLAVEMIDFSNTSNKNVIFNNNIVSGGNKPFTLASNVKFIQHYGNYSTNSGYVALPSDRVIFDRGISASSVVSNGSIQYGTKLTGPTGANSSSYVFTIANDSVYTLQMAGNTRGAVEVFSNTGDGIFGSFMQGDSNLYTIAVSSTVVNNGNSILSGTTGADGKLNISKNSGVLYIENRLGVLMSFVVYIRGGTV